MELSTKSTALSASDFGFDRERNTGRIFPEREYNLLGPKKTQKTAKCQPCSRPSPPLSPPTSMLPLPDEIRTEVELIQKILDHRGPGVQLIQHIPGGRHGHGQHEGRVADRLRTERVLEEVGVRRVPVQHPHRETSRGCRPDGGGGGGSEGYGCRPDGGGGVVRGTLRDDSRQ